MLLTLLSDTTCHCFLKTECSGIPVATTEIDTGLVGIEAGGTGQLSY